MSLAHGLCGVSDSRHTNPFINQRFRAAFLSVEGASELQTRRRHPITHHGRCSHASYSLQVILIPQTNESDVSCAISYLWLSKTDLFYCSELPCLPVTLLFTLSSFSVCVCQHWRIIGVNLDYLSMPYIGYSFTGWCCFGVPSRNVSEHSMHIYTFVIQA